MTQVVAQPKFVLKSMSIWGAITSVISMAIAVVGPIAEATGYSNPVQPGDVEVVSQAGASVIGALGTLAGSVLVIWGRFRAGKTAQPITITPNAPVQTITIAKPPAVGKSTG